ncbi:MAG: hypothetical protein EOP08_00320 [Proteobacteria bacterium]|nr:MAG: hypothetical protein EOP08_00320 [Pseudomonadota bacterium]
MRLPAFDTGCSSRYVHATSTTRRVIWKPLPSKSIRVAGLDAVEIAAGGDRKCAIRRDGRVVCWGDNFEHVLKDWSDTVLRTPTELAF